MGNARRVGSFPVPEDLKLSNDAIKLDAVVLYADLDESTRLVDTKRASFAAEVYKSFLHCTAKIIVSEGGVITADDGDRIMGVFIGDSMCDCAARAGLKINYARYKSSIRPSKNNIQTQTMRKSMLWEWMKLSVCRETVSVVRMTSFGSEDPLTMQRNSVPLSNDFPTRITSEIYINLSSSCRLGANGQNMWEEVWNNMNRTIYRSAWT